MKKLLFLLALIPALAFSQTFKLQPRISFEVAPKGYLQDGDYSYNFGNVRTKVGMSLLYKNFEASFDNHTFMDKGKTFFRPTRTDYYSRINYKPTEKIKVFIEHLCSHPVLTYSRRPEIFYQGYTSIGVSYGY